MNHAIYFDQQSQMWAVREWKSWKILHYYFTYDLAMFDYPEAVRTNI